jgi:hypothetical protein
MCRDRVLLAITTQSAAADTQPGADDEQLEPILFAGGRDEFAAHRDDLTVPRALKLLVVIRLDPAGLYRRTDAQRLVVIVLNPTGFELRSDRHCLISSDSHRATAVPREIDDLGNRMDCCNSFKRNQYAGLSWNVTGSHAAVDGYPIGESAIRSASGENCQG